MECILPHLAFELELPISFLGMINVMLSAACICEYVSLVPLFNGISTFEGNLMPKPSLLNNSSDTI